MKGSYEELYAGFRRLIDDYVDNSYVAIESPGTVET